MSRWTCCWATATAPSSPPSNTPLGAIRSPWQGGDFNGDGKPDLAVANGYPSSTVSVLLGKGDGSFQAAVNYPAGYLPLSVAVGDFNGDGKQDLAVTNTGWDPYTNSSVSILLGKGDGTFLPAVNYAAGAGRRSVAVGDFNGDGKLDLAAAGFRDVYDP